MRGLIWIGAVIGCVVGAAAHGQAVFELRSSAFADNGSLAKANAGKNANNPDCIGDNISPPLTWSNPPDGTRSFAILMYDQRGASGLGVSHWVAYGIPATIGGLSEGEASSPSEKFVGGRNTPGTGTYYGPCPPPGTGLHHYVFTLIATDLEPTALKPQLTREELLEALKGHAKGAADVVARFGR